MTKDEAIIELCNCDFCQHISSNRPIYSSTPPQGGMLAWICSLGLREREALIRKYYGTTRVD